jgi:phospholipid/cholesterol/gamma-HCH transport system permease protein
MNLLVATGQWANGLVDGAGYTSSLLLKAWARVHHLPRRWRFFMDQAFAVGVRALPVTMVVALFAGMILALQTGIELMRLGQGNMIGTITALSMCREMGPFMTALILAATVGSSMAAEIGTMKVSDEVTALDVMSVDKVSYLVVPRVLALTIMCPILTVMADMVGIFGGSIVGSNKLGVSTTYYWITVKDALLDEEHFLPKDVYTGLVKAVVFGCVIAVVSCSTGLRASGGALGVGRAVQEAVKTSILLIIVLGYIITWFFYFLIQ